MTDGSSTIAEGPGDRQLDGSGQEPLDNGAATDADEAEATEEAEDSAPLSPEVLSTEPAVSGEVDVNVTVDAATQFQTLVGFGASQVFYVDWITLNPNKDEIYDVLFRDLGLDVLRVGNWFQGRTMEDQQIQNTLEVARRAEQSLGKKPTLVMSSWTPPADIKSNQQLGGGGTLAAQGGGFAYADFGQWWRESIEASTPRLASMSITRVSRTNPTSPRTTRAPALGPLKVSSQATDRAWPQCAAACRPWPRRPSCLGRKSLV